MNAERIAEFAERLSQVAAAGEGAQALAAVLAETTGGSVLLEDAQWLRLAAAGPSEAPASGRATAENGAPGRCIRLVAGRAHVGWLSLFGNGVQPKGRGAASDLDVLLRVAAAAIGLELARQPDAARGTPVEFWERLLDRVHRDSEAARDDAVAHGIVPASAYLAVVLERDGSDEERSEDLSVLRAIASDVFRSGEADAGVLERGATLLILVPAAREVDASNARTAAVLLPKTVAKRKAGLRFSGGIGTVEPLRSAQRSVASAHAALTIARRVLGPGRVAAYDDLGAYALLYEGADEQRLQAFAARVLTPLRAYDEDHQTELERTLRLYFEVGQNVKTAAARLNVHRHTVFYRLRQIAEICAYSLESPHDQLTLRLAVAIDALHSP